jgi:hypothetical protein
LPLFAPRAPIEPLSASRSHAKSMLSSTHSDHRYSYRGRQSMQPARTRSFGTVLFEALTS